MKVLLSFFSLSPNTIINKRFLKQVSQQRRLVCVSHPDARAKHFPARGAGKYNRCFRRDEGDLARAV